MLLPLLSSIGILAAVASAAALSAPLAAGTASDSTCSQSCPSSPERKAHQMHLAVEARLEGPELAHWGQESARESCGEREAVLSPFSSTTPLRCSLESCQIHAGMFEQQHSRERHQQ